MIPGRRDLPADGRYDQLLLDLLPEDLHLEGEELAVEVALELVVVGRDGGQEAGTGEAEGLLKGWHLPAVKKDKEWTLRMAEEAAERFVGDASRIISDHSELGPFADNHTVSFLSTVQSAGTATLFENF